MNNTSNVSGSFNGGNNGTGSLTCSFTIEGTGGTSMSFVMTQGTAATFSNISFKQQYGAVPTSASFATGPTKWDAMMDALSANQDMLTIVSESVGEKMKVKTDFVTRSQIDNIQNILIYSETGGTANGKPINYQGGWVPFTALCNWFWKWSSKLFLL